MLPRVSRSFALGISLLPRGLYRPITLSYLLCRIADSIEDGATLSVARRQELLALLQRALTDPGVSPGPLAAAASGTGPQDLLLRSTDRVLAEFRRLPPGDQACIVPRVEEMISGMSQSLPVSGQPGLRFAVLADLERYCYYVAGTVGHLLTGLFQRHCPGIDADRHAALSSRATGFGLGLQLTNVIRDLPEDHADGRILVPDAIWHQAHLTPELVFQPTHQPQSVMVLQTLVVEADRHLRTALEYCRLLPRRAFRVRLFCLSSMIFARRTLGLVWRQRAAWSVGQRLKMSRAEVYLLLLASALAAPFNSLSSWLFTRVVSGRNALPATAG
jgi:farnesyl-diphosphate farnesyltransferase